MVPPLFPLTTAGRMCRKKGEKQEGIYRRRLRPLINAGYRQNCITLPSMPLERPTHRLLPQKKKKRTRILCRIRRTSASREREERPCSRPFESGWESGYGERHFLTSPLLPRPPRVFVKFARVLHLLVKLPRYVPVDRRILLRGQLLGMPVRPQGGLDNVVDALLLLWGHCRPAWRMLLDAWCSWLRAAGTWLSQLHCALSGPSGTAFRVTMVTAAAATVPAAAGVPGR